MPGNFTRGAKRLNNGGDKGEGGGGGGGSGEADNDDDAEVTYFSPAKDEYAGDEVATRVAEEVRSVNPTIEIDGFKLQLHDDPARP